MSMRELKTWQAFCDGCGRAGPIITEQYTPRIPENWSHRTVHDCGMTGYTRHDILCDSCTVEARKRAIALAG